MNIGIVYPTVAAFIEKMASMWPDEVTVVGPPPDQIGQWDKRILKLARARDRVKEWEELELRVRFEERPYEEVDFGRFDVLFECVETVYYAEAWREHRRRVECPVVTKVLWADSFRDLDEEYVKAVRRFPVLVEMPAHFSLWNSGPFEDVRWVPEPVGDWWFEQPWVGDIEKVLFVLAGKDIWRPGDKTVCGVDWWERIEERFPGRTHHHDGALEFKTAREMAEMMSRYRCFVNLDREGARPLAAVFTEAVSAGMPVAAREHPTLSYGRFIDGNGVCTDRFEVMAGFIEGCLASKDIAEAYSRRSREIGEAAFSKAVCKPVYEQTINKAQAVFKGMRGLR